MDLTLWSCHLTKPHPALVVHLCERLCYEFRLQNISFPTPYLFFLHVWLLGQSGFC